MRGFPNLPKHFLNLSGKINVGPPTVSVLVVIYLPSVQFSSAGSIYAFWFDISVIATYAARGYLVWTLLGIILFLRSLYYMLVKP